MNIPRSFSLAAQYVLDQWIPPALRDTKWVMGGLMRIVLGRNARHYLDFKNQAFALSDPEFADVYCQINDASPLQGETDLNERCAEKILENLRGATVLEAGCGRGYLAGRMARTHEVTATDIVLDESAVARYPDVDFTAANVEALPFPDRSFDTVVCTHTLEHVQNLQQAIGELRRVARERVIIVVPRQRPYKYGFNLHIHFFPYTWSLQGYLGYRENAVICNLGDWYYHEDVEQLTPDPTGSAGNNENVRIASARQPA
ncbi:MAG: class I SAM-dependent methyltransferase [Catenulisporales bacterium]|nr:class I SAM-dependent methyltransferase [Catenulisporales bacterium]